MKCEQCGNDSVSLAFLNNKWQCDSCFSHKTFETYENLVRDWAKAKGIFEKSTAFYQFEKLAEEIGELHDALLAGDRGNILLEAGDCLVTLINLVAFLGATCSHCLSLAYEKIKDRKGEMKDGFFVKKEKDPDEGWEDRQAAIAAQIQADRIKPTGT